MPKVEVNGIKMYYEIHGEGEPLVMIMGLTANTDWWTPEVIEKASKYFKLIIFDNRGTGDTENPKGSFSIKMFADDTVALMDALGIEKAHILGVSMGGMIAQEIVLNYPERVKKLILGCTNCGGLKQIVPSKEILKHLSQSADGKEPEEVLENSIPTLFPPKFINENPEFIDKFKKLAMKKPITEDAYKRQLKAVLKFRTYRRLKNIDVPTLIIHGKEDVLVPVGNAKILSEQIPNSKLVLLDGAGHSFFGPSEDIAFNAILEFLQSPK